MNPMIVFKVAIPIICGILYRVGGMDQFSWCPLNQKLWRSWGIPLTLWLGLCLFASHPIAMKIAQILLLVIMYWGICGLFPYGSKSWLNFLGEYGKFFVSGFVFGISTFPVIALLALAQGIISGVAYLVIKYLDDKNIMKNPFVEFFRGFFGTIACIWG